MSESWHLSKTTSVGTILTVIILFTSQIYSYGKSAQRIETLTDKIEVATKDRIHKSTVEQMFAVKEEQIKSISNDIKDIKDSQKEQQKILMQILQKLPQ